MMRVGEVSEISSAHPHFGFHQIVQVSPKRFQEYLDGQGSSCNNCDLSFTGTLPIVALNLFGAMAVFAVEVHPNTGKIVEAQHREFNMGASKEEIGSFITKLSPDFYTYIYLIGGGERIINSDFPLDICTVIDLHMKNPGSRTKARLNNILDLKKHPFRKDHDFISACLCSDGILRYCLHDFGFNAPN